MINKVILIGRITNDLNLRYSKTNKPFLYFTVACNNFNNQADFINCVAWEKIAESMQNYLRKGSLVYVEGRIQSRRQDQNGVMTTVTDIRATNVKFLDSRNKNKGNETNSQPAFVENYGANLENNNVDGFDINNMNFDFISNEQAPESDLSVAQDDAIAWGE